MRFFPWLFLWGILSLPSAAQDIPTRIQEPELRTQGVGKAEKAVEESEKRTGLDSDGDVTYEQVLERPDDVVLNYRYALSQVRKGNLRSAAATLERILMVHPELPKVRLVYAVVLYRLDDIDDAERELGALKSQKMPPSLRRELDDYLSLLHKRRRRTHLDILLGAGLEYDDNRNAAPATGQRLFFDVPIILNSNSTRQNDTAKIFLGSLALTHDLGYQTGHRLFLDYNYYRAEQTHQRTLNIQNHSADAGFVYKGRWADVTPSFEFDHLLLTQTTYLRSRGARLRLERRVTPRWGAFLESAYTRQEYNRTLIVPTGNERTGDRIEGTGGVNYVLTPNMSVLASYTHYNQGAAEKFDAYRRESFAISHSWLLGRGQFLLSAAIFNFDRYEKPELAVSKNDRKDNTIRARLTYGLPFGFVSQSLQDLILLATYEYYNAHSSLINYSYSDNKASALFTYKWQL